MFESHCSRCAVHHFCHRISKVTCLKEEIQIWKSPQPDHLHIPTNKCWIPLAREISTLITKKKTKQNKQQQAPPKNQKTKPQTNKQTNTKKTHQNPTKNRQIHTKMLPTGNNYFSLTQTQKFKKLNYNMHYYHVPFAHILVLCRIEIQ